MKHPAILLLAFLAAATAMAQNPLRFVKTEHDFGTLMRNNPGDYAFKFVNIGAQPAKLRDVKASCGCTTPKWTQEALAPGDTGTVQVRYNAASMGNFTKTISVWTEGVEIPTTLKITGIVDEPLPAEPVVKYEFKQGNLGLEKTEHNLGNINSDKPAEVEFKLKNLGPHKITFKGEDQNGPMYSAKPNFYQLEPGMATFVRITVDAAPEKVKTYGFFSDTIRLATDDPEQPVKKFLLRGTTNRVYSAAELAAAPNIEFEKTDVDGGEIIEGEKFEHTYTFKNTGKADLVIESVKPSCGCTTPKWTTTPIPPGGTGEIKTSFDSKGRPGEQNKSITVISNDLDQKNLVLRFKVKVLSDPFHQNNGSILAPAGK